MNRNIKIVFAVAIVMIIVVLALNNGINAEPNSTQAPYTRNGITSGNVRSFQFENGNRSELTVAAGSSVKGTVPIKITSGFFFNFYVDDRGWVYNTTKPSLPAGISVSIEMYGNSYDAVPLTVVYADRSLPLFPSSLLPLAPTSLGVTSVEYTLSVASDVPAGVYTVLIIFQSVTNDGEAYRCEKGSLHYGYAIYYEVVLHVQ